MTRQLLALIALLTGLAAVNAPAQAENAEAIACEIAASASQASCVDQACELAEIAQMSARRLEAPSAIFSVQRAKAHRVRSVWMKADRAYE